MRAAAQAKINLALVVGPRRDDGRHELLTVYQRVALADRISVRRGRDLRVGGFGEDTIVRRALVELAAAKGVEPRFKARIQKRIPVAAGLGGGSSDAATALRLANDLLDEPLPRDRLHALAGRLGADVPYFLEEGPRLASADGTRLEPVELPQDYTVLLVLPHGVVKRSTADVYAEFDARGGHQSFDDRRARLLEALAVIRRPPDLESLPPNDLVSSPLGDRLRELGAFRADVSGAGPIVFGLFTDGARARAARRSISPDGRTWITTPAWYL